MQAYDERADEYAAVLGSMAAVHPDDRALVEEWADARVGGVLSWYSLVHHEPDAVPIALAEFRRVLVPGGGLLVGCFSGPVLEPFEHAVTTAYRWPVDCLAAVLEAAGFRVDAVHRRTDDGVRPHAALVARRS